MPKKVLLIFISFLRDYIVNVWILSTLESVGNASQLGAITGSFCLFEHR